ncbi:hypothetical protein GCM10023189_22610 [Nibrella saemangeumensis]|uniref:Uncharacterized protein n=1 Tax=Nibrella saemangeumensis TaxID=1084526 RepID=A0ABP8MTF7_9BACT
MHDSTADLIPDQPPGPTRPTLLLVGMVLLFLLLAWGVWWYFEWKIETLNHQVMP